MSGYCYGFTYIKMTFCHLPFLLFLIILEAAQKNKRDDRLMFILFSIKKSLLLKTKFLFTFL